MFLIYSFKGSVVGICLNDFACNDVLFNDLSNPIKDP